MKTLSRRAADAFSPAWPRRRALWACVALASLAALWTAPARAADLQVSPVLIEFGPREQAQALWLSNSGTAPLQAQVRVMRWQQAGGLDLLAATAEVVASPPAMVIAPGARQLVRLVRRDIAAPAAEQAYRIMVDELPVTSSLPSPAEAGSSAINSPRAGGLQFLLRYSIPVFVSPVDAVPAMSGALADVSALRLAVEAAPLPVQVSVHNAGPRWAKLSDLIFVDTSGRRTPLVQGLAGYVLPGQTMRWSTPALPLAQWQDGGGVFKARINSDLDEQALPLRPAGR